MRTENITSDNMGDYAGIIPAEYGDGLAEGSLFAKGVIFNDEPAGAVVWHEDKSGIGLDSIYVHSEYRRLGAGTMLMEDLVGKPLRFSYVATGDAVTLEPFFQALDIVTERSDCDLVSFSMEEAITILNEKKISKASESGVTGSELTMHDKTLLGKWLWENYGASIQPYIEEKPVSVFAIKDGEVKAAVMLREGEGDSLDLDFAYIAPGSEALLAGLMNRALKANIGIYPPERRIEMLLTTDDGRKLYERLFGKAQIKVPMIMSI